MYSVTFLILALMSMVIYCKANDDEYVNDARNTCYKSQDTYSCLKFRTLRYISTVVGDDSWDIGNDTANAFANRSFISLVRMKKYRDWSQDSEAETYFSETRQFNEDSEVEKFVKFGKRQIEKFLRSYGLSFGLPDGAVAVPFDVNNSEVNEVARSSGLGKEARGKKKKLAILLPLLSLLSLFKVKLLLIPILITILFVKKILVLSALFLPTILSTLKICKVPQIPTHNQWAAGEANADYGYGGYGGYAGNSAHAKDWGGSRAYAAYNTYNKDNYENQQQQAHQSYRTLGDSPPITNLVYASNSAV